MAAAHWDTSKPGLPLFRKLVKDRVDEAVKGRAEIQAAPDDTARAIQEARHRTLEARLKEVRLMGDAVIAAFFAEDKPRAREKKRAEVESWLAGSLEAAWDKLAALAVTLKHGTHPLPPFHWEIEYPEVFARKNGGFDAILGNPPFMRGKAVGTSLGASYRDWLKAVNPLSNASADLVALFFRKAFQNLRVGGALGLIATKTISEGDTRRAGLRFICTHNGTIYRAVRRLKWPGEAAVLVAHFISLKQSGAVLSSWTAFKWTKSPPFCLSMAVTKTLIRSLRIPIRALMDAQLRALGSHSMIASLGQVQLQKCGH
jgi:hypothetical protein